MKAINLRGITESLSESEMKHVVGGLDLPMVAPDDMGSSNDGCANNFCNSDSDCCTTEPHCKPIPNWTGNVCCSNC